LALVLLGALLGLAVVAWLSCVDRQDGERAVEPGATPAPTPSVAPAEEPGGQRQASGPVNGAIEVGIDHPYKRLPRSFEGTGTITGVVEVVGGRPFPTSWRLVIEPSRFGVGREHAERREREFDGSQRTFEEQELALGGYRIYAEAPGLNSRVQEVLLFRLAGSAGPSGGIHKHLILHLTPSGFMDGAVTDERGQPVPGLPVVLENLADHSRLTTQTNGAGVWRFDGLVDGRYQLFLGDPNGPLIPAEPINYLAPQRRHPDQVVPCTSTVEIITRDELGVPVEGVTVRGFGTPHGTFTVVSESDGVARVHFLRAGRYRVRASGREGQRGKADFVLDGTQELERVEIQMHPEER